MTEKAACFNMGLGNSHTITADAELGSLSDLVFEPASHLSAIKVRSEAEE